MMILDILMQANGGGRSRRNGKAKCELLWATKERGKGTHVGFDLTAWDSWPLPSPGNSWVDKTTVDHHRDFSYFDQWPNVNGFMAKDSSVV